MRKSNVKEHIMYQKTKMYVVNRLVVPIFLKLRTTPNQISIGRFIILVPITVYLFALGNYVTNISAVVLMYLFTFFDMIDGKIARIRNMSTPLGAKIDTTVDLIGHNLFFLVVCFCVVQQGGSWSILGIFDVSIPRNILLYCAVISYSASLFSDFFITRFKGIDFREDLMAKVRGEESQVKNNSINPVVSAIVLPYLFSWNIFFSSYSLIIFGSILNLLPIMIMLMSITLTIRFSLVLYVYFKTRPAHKYALDDSNNEQAKKQDNSIFTTILKE
jgi:phosphatidylserine synthase